MVGRDYGGEPNPETLPAGQPRRSWTQIEYDLARQHNQKLYLIVCDDAFPFDPPVAPAPSDKIALQRAHREAVLTDNNLWNLVRTLDELQRQIENLKVPLDEVRAELRRHQIRHRLVTSLVGMAIVMVLVGVIYGVRQLGKKVDRTGGQVTAVGKDVRQVEQMVGDLPAKIEDAQQETVRQLTDPVALGESIRKQIKTAAEAKVAALPAERGRWQKVADIEKERDVALGRVDDLMKLIQEGLKEGALRASRAEGETLYAGWREIERADAVGAELRQGAAECRPLRPLAGVDLRYSSVGRMVSPRSWASPPAFPFPPGCCESLAELQCRWLDHNQTQRKQ